MATYSATVLRAISARAAGRHGNSKPNFAARDRANENTLKYYAAALSAIIALCFIAHLIRYWSTKYRTSSRLPLSLIATPRAVRRVVLRSVPGFSSIGQAILVLVYIAINLVFSFTGYDGSGRTWYAARFGWMSAANLTLVVFLALKNTPLAILTSYSYERLNKLHQIAGYATTIHMILHGALFSSYFIQTAMWEVLQQWIVTAGIVLGFAMLITTLEAVFLRKIHYETFYVVHVILFIVIVITLGLHRPDIQQDKIAIVAIISGAIWALDRLIRFSRWLYNSINNQASIYPLPNGGTRILLHKPLPCAEAGGHCFVWLPRIRYFETHPFSIVNTSPTELVVNSYSGFTKDLHKYAKQNPGQSLKISLEGPYGKFPNPSHYDKVILIAGGSGATFTFGLVNNMLKNLSDVSNKSIDFIWVVRKQENLSWFADHLNTLRSTELGSRIKVKLYVTAPAGYQEQLTSSGMLSRYRAGTVTSDSSGSPWRSSSSSSSSPPSEKEEDEMAFASPHASRRISDPSTSGSGTDEDLEKADPGSGRRASQFRATNGLCFELPIEHGRPDVEALIKAAVESTPIEQRVLVAGCGPRRLMAMVRNATAESIWGDGPSVELHCERFGW